MPSCRLRLREPDERFVAGFTSIRDELGVTATFPPEVLAAAAEAVTAGPAVPPAGGAAPVDRRDVELVTIDPAGSRDLDQAYGAQRRQAGVRVHYAIADVSAFVAPGGAIDDEARERGVTLYAPDQRCALHPESISEGAASLLPSADRQALLWTIDLDADGEIETTHVERSIVRSREMLTYRDAQTRIDQGHHEILQLLKTIGELRQERERDRGAVSLTLPDQEVVRHDGHYHLDFAENLPVEGWNAQISLLTGIAAARIMCDAGVGIIRTLPEPEPDTIAEIRRAALGLGIEWPDTMDYAERIRTLDPNRTDDAVLMRQSVRALRGAGYTAFTEPLTRYPPHSAIASVYAHVTAPLRRVCDRFANEVLLALCADREPPEWAVSALDDLPSIMGRCRQRESALDRAAVDLVEAIVLTDRVGDTFSALVMDVGDASAQIKIDVPPIIASVPADGLRLGDQVELRLLEADPTQRLVRFEPVR